MIKRIHDVSGEQQFKLSVLVNALALLFDPAPATFRQILRTCVFKKYCYC